MDKLTWNSYRRSINLCHWCVDAGTCILGLVEYRWFHHLLMKPHSARDIADHFRHIMKESKKPIPLQWSDKELVEVRKLIQHCCSFHENDRPNIDEVVAFLETTSMDQYHVFSSEFCVHTLLHSSTLRKCAFVWSWMCHDHPTSRPKTNILSEHHHSHTGVSFCCWMGIVLSAFPHISSNRAFF